MDVKAGGGGEMSGWAPAASRARMASLSSLASLNCDGESK